jgi:uncharacterized damage-inducible protein DinB
VTTPRSDQIDAYLAGPSNLRLAVAGMSRDQLLARPVAGRWSSLEVVCHLTDSEQAWCHRMKRVIAEDRPLLIGYDESKFTASLDYHASDVASELALIEAMRRQLAGVLRRLPDAAWSRAGVHNERGLIRLDEMLTIETEHIAHHIGHILQKRRALGLPDPG